MNCFFITFALFLITNATCNIREGRRGEKQYRPAKRIVGGHQVSITEYPHIVAIVVKKGVIVTETPEDTFLCGGTIVSTYHVLTAGHCMMFLARHSVDLSTVTIRGNVERWNDTSLTNMRTHRVDLFKIHAEYDDYPESFGVGGIENNIAIVQVVEPFKGQNEKPVQIASVEYRIPENAVGIVLGWGYTESIRHVVPELRSAVVKLYGQMYCQQIYGRAYSNSMICAGSSKVGACLQDSGGPLIDANKTLIGFISFGMGCVTARRKPQVYLYLPAYRVWLNKTIQLLKNFNKRLKFEFRFVAEPPEEPTKRDF